MGRTMMGLKSRERSKSKGALKSTRTVVGLAFVLILLSIVLIVLSACSNTSSYPKSCRNLEGNQRDVCTIKLATSEHNADLCSAIEKESFNTWCLTDVAKTTENISVCDRIKDQRSQEFCKRDIIVKSGDANSCGSLTGTARDDCYDRIAINSSDWHICLNMSEKTGSYRDECIDKNSRKELNPYGCLEIRPGKLRESCLFSMSIASDTLETCNDIINETFSEFCVVNIASKRQDTSVCDLLQGKKYHTLCVQAANGTAKGIVKGNVTA